MIYMDLTGYKLYLLAIFEIKTQYVFDFLITMLTTLFLLKKLIDKIPWIRGVLSVFSSPSSCLRIGIAVDIMGRRFLRV